MPTPVAGEDGALVHLSDNAAAEAFRHPARSIAITELYRTQNTYTASQLAEITGISPSSMSYHLRLLERRGLVRPGENNGDSRERHWRARGTEIMVSLTGKSHLAELAERGFNIYGSNLRMGAINEDIFDSASYLLFNRLYLTPDQVSEVQLKIRDIFLQAQKWEQDAEDGQETSPQSVLATVVMLGMPVPESQRLIDGEPPGFEGPT